MEEGLEYGAESNGVVWGKGDGGKGFIGRKLVSNRRQ